MTWPSTHAVGTLGYMRDRIDDQLKRSGTIDTRITACINDAVAIYQPHRFRFNELRSTFNTAVGTEFYSVATVSFIQSLYRLDYLTLLVGNSRFDLDRVAPEDIELATQNGTQLGQPQKYSYYHENFRFYPVPDAVYEVLVAAHVTLAAPVSDDEAGNRWMSDAERLIRCRALYELAVHHLNDPELAARMHPETGAAAAAYYELTRTAQLLTATGRVRPTQF